MKTAGRFKVWAASVILTLGLGLSLGIAVYGQTTQTCPTCDGTGRLVIQNSCNACGGKGSTVFMGTRMGCAYCGGTGVFSIPCTGCNGIGRVTVTQPSSEKQAQPDNAPAMPNFVPPPGLNPTPPSGGGGGTGSGTLSICTFCKGKREVFGDFSTGYGVDQTVYCNICEKIMQRHYHIRCNGCGGTGYR